MPGVERDSEERVAQVAVDDGLEFAAHLADVQRLVPVGHGREVRRDEAFDIVVGSVGKLRRILDDESGPAVERSPDPKAIVNGSPRSIGRSPGLRSPNLALGPALSMRWQESGAPFHLSSSSAVPFGHSRLEAGQDTADS